MCKVCALIEFGPTHGLVVNNDDSSPDSTATTNSMDVGDTFHGEINAVGDWDWIAIELTAGETVEISMDRTGGDAAFDPLLYLYSSAGGSSIANDNDSGSGNGAQIVYTATSSGTYYIAADESGLDNVGTYSVTVVETTAPPGGGGDGTVDTQPLNTLDWGGNTVPGTSTSGGTIDVWFATSGYSFFDSDFGTIDAESWSSFEIGQFEEAFDIIESITNLTFNIVSSESAADFILVNDNDDIGAGGTLGFFNPPGTGSQSGIGVFASDNWDDFANGDLELGGYGFVTIMHELLHGLGLSHPHDNGGGSSVMNGVTSSFGSYGDYLLNQGVFTTMSYNSGFNAGAVGTVGASNGNYGYEVGPMALDIAVLQDKYGANTSYNTGDNTYTLVGANGTGTMWASIWDAGGTDQILYDGDLDVVIDLRPATLENAIGGGGYLSAADGIAGGYTIANGVVIENATGGDGNDVITGNDADNTLYGNNGEDVLYGGLGDDEIRSGRQDDSVFGGDGDDFLNGSSGDDYMDGGEDDDYIEGRNDQDELYGGVGEDRVFGQRHGDTIYGGDDDDRVNGGGGNDIVYGGDGNDFVKGGSRKDSVYGGDGDDIVSGNTFDDELYGGADDDRLFGGSENDTLDGGTGNDFLRGGEDQDTFIFNVGHDSDIVDDFSVTEDTLQLHTNLVNGQSAQQIVDGASINGTTVTIDFGGGDIITLVNIADAQDLVSQIDILSF